MVRRARLIPAKLLSSDERIVFESRPSAVVYMVSATIVMIIGLAAVVLYAWQYIPGSPSLPYIQEYLDGDYGLYIHYALLVVVVLCLLYFIARWLRWSSTIYAVTDERVITQRGILNKTYEDVPLTMVTNVDISQSLGKRVLRYGTIRITSQASSGNRATMTWTAVPSPLTVRRKIQEGMDTRTKPRV